jgi:hypothetical protein
MSILIIKFCYKNSIDQLKITLLNVLSDVRMCEKYKIYPIVYTVIPELRGARDGPFPIFLNDPIKVMAFYEFVWVRTRVLKSWV